MIIINNINFKVIWDDDEFDKNFGKAKRARKYHKTIIDDPRVQKFLPIIFSQRQATKIEDLSGFDSVISTDELRVGRRVLNNLYIYNGIPKIRTKYTQTMRATKSSVTGLSEIDRIASHKLDLYSTLYTDNKELPLYAALVDMHRFADSRLFKMVYNDYQKGINIKPVYKEKKVVGTFMSNYISLPASQYRRTVKNEKYPALTGCYEADLFSNFCVIVEIKFINSRQFEVMPHNIPKFKGFK